MDPVDYWRIGNILLGTATLIALIVDLKRRYDALSKRDLYFSFAFLLLIFATILGSAAAVLRINPTGLRTSIYTAAYLWCLIGLWMTHDDPL